MSTGGWHLESSPFHPGEQELHARLGRTEQQEKIGRATLRPYMPDQHRQFFAEQPFIVAGTVDEHGLPWASILFGEPGFISTPDDRTMHIAANPVAGDRLNHNLAIGSPIGLVGIHLGSRRRNRMNGIVRAVNEASIEVGVVQSFGNCPQYIQARDFEFVRAPHEASSEALESFEELDSSVSEIIRNADTLFVASHNERDDAHSHGGADVNHRGGKPGFVRVTGNTLTIPDYAGNNAFNTLGNFLVTPRAGLIFIDFEQGDLVQLTGTTKILWEPTDEIRDFQGAQRAWQVHVSKGYRLRSANPLRFGLPEMSPRTLKTGQWE